MSPWVDGLRSRDHHTISAKLRGEKHEVAGEEKYSN